MPKPINESMSARTLRVEKEKADELKLSQLNKNTQKTDRLFRQIEVYRSRSNTVTNANGRQTLDPRGANELVMLEEVRQDLMKNPWGLLDFGIVRKSFEWNSLNPRQKAMTKKHYPFMIDELEDDIEWDKKLDSVILVKPLEVAYDALSEDEKSLFSAVDRSSIHYAEEIQGYGKSEQPYAVSINHITKEETPIFGLPLSMVE